MITGSTVVLTCCKGDCQRQWKTPIFGLSELENLLTDFDKFETDHYIGDATPHTKFGFCTFSGGVSPYRWSCHPQCLLFYLSFFYFLTLLTCPDHIVRRRNIVNG